MKIKISTTVEAIAEDIFKQFNVELFKKLAPPLMSIKLLRWDGNTEGCQIHLKLMGQDWISKIVYFEETNKHILFVDEGIKLPFPFKKWKHHHILERADAHTIITDELEYSTGLLVLDLLLYPITYFQFWYRKHIYRGLKSLD